MSQLPVKTPIYDDGRTKQSFADETDINIILKRAQRTGTISHLAKHEGRYADFSNFDFQENLLMLSRGREIFDELPVELRSEFEQSPAQFFKYVNDPANVDRLAELLPDLARPGRQNVTVSQVETADELAAREASIEPLPKVAPEQPGGTPEDGVLKVSEPPSGRPDPPST